MFNEETPVSFGEQEPRFQKLFQVMLKIQISNRKVSPFGGINFVIDEIESAGIPTLIADSLGKRHGRSKYSYGDAILGMIYGVFCGATRLEDMKKLKGQMHNSSLNIPSPDVLGKIMKNHLATENFIVTGPTGIDHPFNENKPLNGLMIDIALHLNQLNKAGQYTLDYDNTCLPGEKWDAEYCYKGFKGYQPGAAWIGETPVFIEGMNGNNPAAFQQPETLQRCFDLLDEKEVQISRFRADSASYQKEIIDKCVARGMEFFIRAENSDFMWEHINDVHCWKPVRLGNDRFEIASFNYYPFVKDKAQLGTHFLKHKHRFDEYRIVVSRRPHSNGDLHSKTEEPYIYRSIITNNWEMADEDVVHFYNQRGGNDCEKNFDVMNNDWNWACLPFSFMNENTAFMIITAMGFILYKYLLRLFAGRADFVEPTFRMKAFRFNVITVAAEWEGERLLIHDQSRPWEQLIKNRAS